MEQFFAHRQSEDVDVDRYQNVRSPFSCAWQADAPSLGLLGHNALVGNVDMGLMESVRITGSDMQGVRYLESFRLIQKSLDR